MGSAGEKLAGLWSAVAGALLQLFSLVCPVPSLSRTMGSTWRFGDRFSVCFQLLPLSCHLAVCPLQTTLQCHAVRGCACMLRAVLSLPPLDGVTAPCCRGLCMHVKRLAQFQAFRGSGWKSFMFVTPHDYVFLPICLTCSFALVILVVFFSFAFSPPAVVLKQ